jgi:hypothetical protein
MGRPPDALPADIAAAYKHALPEALTLLAKTLTARMTRPPASSFSLPPPR